MAKILVVDDEDQICSMLKELFELDGHMVLTACDGLEAERVITAGIDLAIVDIIMPNKTGIDFVHELRGTRPDMPILLISGGGSFKSGADDELYKKWIEMERLIHKPFSNMEIRQVVGEMLGAA